LAKISASSKCNKFAILRRLLLQLSCSNNEPGNREKKIVLTDNLEAMAILGRHDEVLRLINEQFSSKVTARGNEIVIVGEPAEVIKLLKLFDELLYLYRSGNPITIHDVNYSVRMLKEGKLDTLHSMYSHTLVTTARGRQIRPKTLGHYLYLEAIRQNFITFGIGPAGTGKHILLLLWR
jgi:phosphate starvation-inducible PhoH-like protein